MKCGSLLKKWDSIPGREVTPPRETTPGSCWSPDLFESDGEIISSSYIEMKRPKTPLGIDSLTTCPNLVDNFTRRPETESDKDDNDCTALKLHESLSPIVIVSDSDDDLPHCENVDMRVSPVLNKPTERYSDAEKTASNSSSFSESKQVQTSPIDNENIDQSWSFTTQSLSGPNEMQNSVVVVESDDDLDLICSQECQYTSGDELEQYFGSQESPEKLVRQPETPPNDYNLHDDTVLLNERGGDKVVTPQSNLIVKCDNVTPCPDYDRMLTPEVVRELDKFGFKAVKRRKGVKLLKYIYDSTHPLVRVSEKPQVKRKKLDSVRDKTVCSEKCASLESNVEVVGDLLSER